MLAPIAEDANGGTVARLGAGLEHLEFRHQYEHVNSSFRHGATVSGFVQNELES
jgi:hypothetical protein